MEATRAQNSCLPCSLSHKYFQPLRYSSIHFGLVGDTSLFSGDITSDFVAKPGSVSFVLLPSVAQRKILTLLRSSMPTKQRPASIPFHNLLQTTSDANLLSMIT